MDSNSLPPGMVLLTTTVEVNGQRLQARAHASIEMWSQDEQYQEVMKAALLRSLGEAIVTELKPEITVTKPQPTLHAALTDALRPFDYPTEY
ncbi:hypothetical protein [Kitasatospora aureofaciens]|uniref:hypothetical protein n=1 Tax=Kitasatospora aureofaciens TaxID=1894 RepID=UPI0033CD9115